ncbi:hypothetical protein C4M97_03460 [Mycoplasmopsis pullorum]|uniref:MurR/RpiR family transcriptional regulator n=4 Tax=Mycoplasmopsis pullorum TaxID=48003 RepID=UPI001118FC59|nr:MurR/RpiR family transcriptional regulator [Mycoplasmopsis pullorum]TNK83557.1 hypothetical protein C4M81_03865 [Mycoplasmopsis pullorum]TNK85539.1 hypothetical protein C4M92_01070 [Mycoplasmopsis pullorum]TNK86209.1 hypothetical protein C4M85_00855 [Mycoplasmopsis pullorum]TNK86531.1 hypothetical protein C4M82_03170 [Mycoplasmopsis pullorum]TNK88350.1 hypothetical protein C4M89_02735 [Mycoplasmopsis pullorum]
MKMKIFESIIIKNNFKPSDIDNYIINYIETNPKEFAQMTQSEICERIFVSQTAVSRFAKKIGFSTFKHLQIYVAAYLEKYQPKNDITLRELDSLENIKKNVFDQYTNLIKMVFTSIDNKQIQILVNLIANNKNIVIFGIGTSYMMGKYFAEQLLKVGVHSVVFNTIYDFVDFYPSAFDNNYNFLIISQNFANTDCVKVAKILKRDMINFSLITKNKSEVLKNDTKINLITYSTFITKNIQFSITNKIAILMILDIILFSLFHKKDPEFKNISLAQDVLKASIIDE